MFTSGSTGRPKGRFVLLLQPDDQAVRPGSRPSRRRRRRGLSELPPPLPHLRPLLRNARERSSGAGPTSSPEIPRPKRCSPFSRRSTRPDSSASPSAGPSSTSGAWKSSRKHRARDRRSVIRSIVGQRLRWGLSAAGYLDPRVFRFFEQAGIHVSSGFGMTEGTGGITMTPPGRYVDNSHGLPLPGIRLRLGPDDELQASGHYVAPYLEDKKPGDLIPFPENPETDYWLAYGRYLPADGQRLLPDRRPDQGHLQKQPGPDDRPAQGRGQVHRRSRHQADLSRRRRPAHQRPLHRPRPERRRPGRGPGRRQRPGILPADRVRGQRRPGPLRAGRQFRRARPGLRRRPGRSHAQGLISTGKRSRRIFPAGSRSSTANPISTFPAPAASSGSPCGFSATSAFSRMKSPATRGGSTTGTGSSAFRLRPTAEPGIWRIGDLEYEIHGTVVDLGHFRPTADPLGGKSRPDPLFPLQGRMGPAARTGDGPGHPSAPARPPPSNGRCRPAGKHPGLRACSVLNEILVRVLFSGREPPDGAPRRAGKEFPGTRPPDDDPHPQPAPGARRPSRRKHPVLGLPASSPRQSQRRLQPPPARLRPIGQAVSQRPEHRGNRLGQVGQRPVRFAPPADDRLPGNDDLAGQRGHPAAVRADPAAVRGPGPRPSGIFRIRPGGARGLGPPYGRPPAGRRGRQAPHPPLPGRRIRPGEIRLPDADKARIVSSSRTGSSPSKSGV